MGETHNAFGVLALVVLVLHAATHLAVVVGLALRPPRWRAAVGFFIAPLGLVWAWREGYRARVWAFGGTLAAYVVLLVGLAARAR